MLINMLCALCCILQAEVDANRVAVLLNIAAVAVEKAEFRTATQLCSRALALEPGSRKALLRRAKAHMGRHEPQVSQQHWGGSALCHRCSFRMIPWLESWCRCSRDGKGVHARCQTQCQRGVSEVSQLLLHAKCSWRSRIWALC